MTMHKLIKLNVECRNHVHAKLSKYLKRDRVRKRSLRLNNMVHYYITTFVVSSFAKTFNHEYFSNKKKRIFHIYIYIYIML